MRETEIIGRGGKVGFRAGSIFWRSQAKSFYNLGRIRAKTCFQYGEVLILAMYRKFLPFWLGIKTRVLKFLFFRTLISSKIKSMYQDFFSKLFQVTGNLVFNCLKFGSISINSGYRVSSKNKINFLCATDSQTSFGIYNYIIKKIMLIP